MSEEQLTLENLLEIEQLRLQGIAYRRKRRPRDETLDTNPVNVYREFMQRDCQNVIQLFRLNDQLGIAERRKPKTTITHTFCWDYEGTGYTGYIIWLADEPFSAMMYPFSSLWRYIPLPAPNTVIGNLMVRLLDTINQ